MYVYVSARVCGVVVISVCLGTCMWYLYPLSFLAGLSQILTAIHKFDSVVKGVPAYAADDSLHFL